MSIRGREARLAFTKDMLMSNLEKVIAIAPSDFPHNQYIDAYGSEIYIRIYPHPRWGRTLDLARITIRKENQHQGIFTHFLQKAKALCYQYNYRAIKVECVLNPVLIPLLEREGFVVFPNFPLDYVWQDPTGKEPLADATAETHTAGD